MLSDSENNTQDSPSNQGILNTNNLTNVPPLNTPIIKNKKLPIGKNRTQPTQFQQQLLQVLDKSQGNEGDDDDDKHFLLSLLPECKKIDENFKMDARIELMQVIRKYSTKNNVPQRPDSYYYDSSHPRSSDHYQAPEHIYQTQHLINPYSEIQRHSQHSVLPHITQQPENPWLVSHQENQDISPDNLLSPGSSYSWS